MRFFQGFGGGDGGSGRASLSSIRAIIAACLSGDICDSKPLSEFNLDRDAQIWAEIGITRFSSSISLPSFCTSTGITEDGNESSWTGSEDETTRRFLGCIYQ